jgi:hypothetical protein
VGLIAPTPRVRNTEFNGNHTGIVITGSGADLGTASDPGDNAFGNNLLGTAVQIDDRVNSALVFAEGNTWNANTQGADASGGYAKPLIVNGLSPLATGTNFDVQQFDSKSSVKIQLASLEIGRLRLTPQVLCARPGKAMRLSMSWTHPKSWRMLRTVELRLYRGSRAVGRVVVSPRGERLSARGAVKLVAGKSRLTHRGKTVTARLALRLPRSFAGQHLRVDVHATDRRGHRQVERDAGAIRVAR